MSPAPSRGRLVAVDDKSCDPFDSGDEWVCPFCERVTRCVYRCDNRGCKKDLAGEHLQPPAQFQFNDDPDDDGPILVEVREVDIDDDGPTDACPDCGSEATQREAVMDREAWWCPDCGDFVAAVGPDGEVVPS